MDRSRKHIFRPGCEDLEGRQLLSSVVEFQGMERSAFPLTWDGGVIP